MGIVVNCLLFIFGTVAAVMGISFYLRNIKYEKETSLILLMYGLSSALWCGCYGIIGLVWQLEWCPYIRMVGIFAVDVFIMTEVYMACKLVNPSKRWNLIIKGGMFILSFIDWVVYANRGVDLYVRIGSWTTWYANPDYQWNRNYHSFYVLIAAALLLLLALIWRHRRELKREGRFVKLLFIANFAFLFGSFPDTFLPLTGHPALSTSGLGAALCTMVVWYGAVQLNYFDIRMGNIAEKFLDFIDAGIIVLDTNKQVSIINKYCQKMLEDAQIANNRVVDLFDLNGYDLKEAFEKAVDEVYTMRVSDKSHTHFYSVRLNALKDDFNTPFCFLCIFTDVTEEMKMIDRLEVASKAKTDFLAQMSHEIRTPINTVLGMNEMILRSNADEQVLEYASGIDSAGRILLSLINSILDFSKIEDGHMEIIPVKYDVASLLTNLVNSISQQAHKKGLQFELDVDSHIPCMLYGDDVRLAQIIMNLLSNAVKYTKEGKVKLILKYLEERKNQAGIYVAVEDTGIGIKQEDIKRLSVSFERLDEVRNHDIEGTGLGISIVTKLLSMMNSKLEVESEYGKGSCFSFIIYQAIVDATPIGDYNERLIFSQRSQAHENLPYAPEAKILVVDDNAMNLKVASQLLSLFGIQPRLASSGLEALECLREEEFDIVFMDHMMPKMDGIETLHEAENQQLRKEETVFVVLTANAVAGARDKYLKEGFADYLSKPIDLLKLSKLLQKYLKKELFVEGPKEEEAPKQKEEYPPIDGVDWNVAYANMPNTSMLLDLMHTFFENSKQDADELDDYMEQVLVKREEEGIESYRIKVHAMKNSCATLGAKEISEEAKALEYAARDEDLLFIEGHHEDFVSKYIALGEGIQKALFPNELPDRKEMDNDTLLRNLTLLETAMDEFDTITLQEISTLLKRYDFENSEIEELMARIQEGIRDFDQELFWDNLNHLKKILERG